MVTDSRALNQVCGPSKYGLLYEGTAHMPTELAHILGVGKEEREIPAKSPLGGQGTCASQLDGSLSQPRSPHSKDE